VSDLSHTDSAEVKREHIYGNKIYSTKAQFCDNGQFHHISIECDTVGVKDPCLEIRVDKNPVMQVKHLAWKFRTGSPPSDGSNDGDDRGRLNDYRMIVDDRRDDEFDESSSRLDPLKFDDEKSITLRRSKLVKCFMEPFFDDLIYGCFMWLCIGKTESGTPSYRMCIVRNVDASDPDQNYKLESYLTCKYLNVVWDSEAIVARWQMTQVSDSPPNEEEFMEWLQKEDRNGARIPTQQEVLDKKEAIQEAYNCVYSAPTVQQMLREKSVVRRPTILLLRTIC
jgi:RNA polymerase-associated protein RTF1